MRTTPHAYPTERIALPRRLVPRRPVDFENDTRFAYLQWLRMEARLLQIELGGDDRGEFTPIGTYTHNFHMSPEKDWRALPQPSTRAEQVLRAVGVNVSRGQLVPEGER
jgi:hypothetical protein